MTVAEEYLNPNRRAEELAGMKTSQGKPQGNVDIGMRCLAIVVFLTLIFVGTYFAKIRNPPQILLGYVIGGIGFGLGRRLWRARKGE